MEVDMMTTAKEIAKYIMETGVKETSEGNWCFRFSELDEQFGTNLSHDVGFIEAVEDILYKVYGDAIFGFVCGGPARDAADRGHENAKLVLCRRVSRLPAPHRYAV